MQSKIESLTTTNALMKEDLAIARGSLYRSQEENKRLMAQLDRTLLSQRNDSLDQPSPTYDTLSKVNSLEFLGVSRILGQPRVLPRTNQELL